MMELAIYIIVVLKQVAETEINFFRQRFCLSKIHSLETLKKNRFNKVLKVMQHILKLSCILRITT